MQLDATLTNIYHAVVDPGLGGNGAFCFFSKGESRRVSIVLFLKSFNPGQLQASTLYAILDRRFHRVELEKCFNTSIYYIISVGYIFSLTLPRVVDMRLAHLSHVGKSKEVADDAET